MKKTKTYLGLAVAGAVLLVADTSSAQISVSSIESQVCGIKQIQTDRFGVVVDTIACVLGNRSWDSTAVIKLNDNTFFRQNDGDSVVAFDKNGKYVELALAPNGLFGRLVSTVKGMVVQGKRDIFYSENGKLKYGFSSENKIIGVLPHGLVLQESDGVRFYSDLSGKLLGPADDKLQNLEILPEYSANGDFIGYSKAESKVYIINSEGKIKNSFKVEGQYTFKIGPAGAIAGYDQNSKNLMVWSPSGEKKLSIDLRTERVKDFDFFDGSRIALQSGSIIAIREIENGIEVAKTERLVSSDSCRLARFIDSNSYNLAMFCSGYDPYIKFNLGDKISNVTKVVSIPCPQEVEATDAKDSRVSSEATQKKVVRPDEKSQAAPNGANPVAVPAR